MDEKVVLINQVDGRFTINFLGAFPNNKFALKKGQKIYLSKEEFEFVQSNVPHLLGNQVILEGEEPKEPKHDHLDPEEFFKQHHATAKAQIKEMELKEVESLIDFANTNELDNAVVNALIKRSNELGE